MKYKLIIFDLDGTIWDHEDISSLTPPFRKISKNTIVDLRGTLVKLYPYVKETLSKLKQMGFILAIVSWNKEKIALEALDAFGLAGLFDYYCIEYHPYKEKMIKKILKKIYEEENEIKSFQVIYIDDRDIHIKDIAREVSGIYFIHMWIDVKNYKDLLKLIKTIT